MKMSGGFVWVLCSFIPRLTEDSGLKPGHLLPQNCHLEKRTFQISKKVLCPTSIFCRARAAFASSTSFLRLTFSFSRKAALKAIWFSFSLLASRDLFSEFLNNQNGDPSKPSSIHWIRPCSCMTKKLIPILKSLYESIFPTFHSKAQLLGVRGNIHDEQQAFEEQQLLVET